MWIWVKSTGSGNSRRGRIRVSIRITSVGIFLSRNWKECGGAVWVGKVKENTVGGTKRGYSQVKKTHGKRGFDSSNQREGCGCFIFVYFREWKFKKNKSRKLLSLIIKFREKY